MWHCFQQVDGERKQQAVVSLNIQGQGIGSELHGTRLLRFVKLIQPVICGYGLISIGMADIRLTHSTSMGK